MTEGLKDCYQHIHRNIDYVLISIPSYWYFRNTAFICFSASTPLPSSSLSRSISVMRMASAPCDLGFFYQISLDPISRNKYLTRTNCVSNNCIFLRYFFFREKDVNVACRFVWFSNIIDMWTSKNQKWQRNMSNSHFKISLRHKFTPFS